MPRQQPFARTNAMIPGRSCPLSYRQRPADMATTPATLRADTLIVAGGLYGNPDALDAIEALAEREGALLAFNGDFHWFDVDADAFSAIQTRVLSHAATAGNVEREIASDSGAGCGCAYPPEIDDATVEYSNRIIEHLRATATGEQCTALARLPSWQLAEVGGRRVAIIHGDPESLASWSLAAERIDDTVAAGRLERWFREAGVHAFACTHTCLPHARSITVDGIHCGVINNGSAGMPNFPGDPRPLVTRIAARPSPRALYRVDLDGLVLEALAVELDDDAWIARFHEWWPEGSPARHSYGQRMIGGPAFSLEQAVGPGTHRVGV